MEEDDEDLEDEVEEDDEDLEDEVEEDDEDEWFGWMDGIWSLLRFPRVITYFMQQWLHIHMLLVISTFLHS